MTSVCVRKLRITFWYFFVEFCKLRPTVADLMRACGRSTQILHNFSTLRARILCNHSNYCSYIFNILCYVIYYDLLFVEKIHAFSMYYN